MKFKPFAIGWLADSFANHHPEIFFAGGASRYLQGKVIEFETHHDLSRRPENLSDWYVNPSVSITQLDTGTFSQRLKKALKLRRLSYNEFRRQLTSEKRFVLSAAPGFGKSTLLRKLALDLYKEALIETASLGTNIRKGELKVPIMVSATEMVEFGNVESFLEKHLPPAVLLEAFSVDCLLVDALDEVPQDNQASTLEFAYKIANHLDCALVVTARPVHAVRVLASGSSPRLPVVHLLPFEYSQAIRLINRLVRDPEIVRILKEGLSSLQAHMALSPLSVSLLLDIAEAEREIPGTIGEIFDQYMDIALGRYDIERGIEVVFQFFIKKQLLSALAWFEFFKKDRLAIPQADFDRFLDDYFDARRLSKEMIPRMKSDIDRSGVVRFSDGVYFAHRAFLDFFVALYMNSHSDEIKNIPKRLADIYFNDKWSEVGFYFFARKRELLPEFLAESSLLDKDNADYHLRRFMIGRLIQAGWLSTSDIKLRGIHLGISSAPKVFGMISSELDNDAPRVIPYGIMMGLSESSYSSRVLHQEVTDVTLSLTNSDSVDDLRSALYLLWANRSRISTASAVDQADRILEQMTRLEKSGRLLLADKTLGFFMLETIVEKDNKLLGVVSRRIRRLLKRQPKSIKKLLSG